MIWCFCRIGAKGPLNKNIDLVVPCLVGQDLVERDTNEPWDKLPDPVT